MELPSSRIVGSSKQHEFEQDPMPYYHYTDLCAAQSIVESGKLWLTDLRYMNDTSELQTGVHYLLRELTAGHPTLFIGNEFRLELADRLSKELAAFMSNFHGQHALYAVSLSCQGDRLSQWRGYGKYAVQLDGTLLGADGHTLSQCVYTHDDKNRAAKRAVNLAFERIAGLKASELQKQTFELKAADLESNEETSKSIIEDEFLSLLKVAATFKSDGFIEEDEMRIIKSSLGTEVKFRPRGELLIPYIEVTITPSSITGVTIGPVRDAHLAEISVRSWADRIRPQHDESGNNPIGPAFRVETSKIPYRD